MSLFFFAIQTASTLGVLSSGVIMKSLSNTTESIYKSLLHIMNLDAPYMTDYISVIRECDINHKHQVIESFIKEQKDIIGMELEDNGGKNSSVIKAITGVADVLSDISVGLKQVEDAVQYHETKFFSSWRAFSCEYGAGNIKKQTILLDERSRLLFSIINANKKGN